MKKTNANILIGLDSTRGLAHVIHLDFLTGEIRSTVKSYREKEGLDHWELYSDALYSDYDIEKEDGSELRSFVANSSPGLSLIEHDIVFKDELTWISILRVLVGTKSKIVINGEHINLTGLIDSNSSLSLVMNYRQDNKFCSKRLSGVNSDGLNLDTSDFVFLTPKAFQKPFDELLKGEPRESVEGDKTVIYNEVSVDTQKHFRDLPPEVLDLFTVSRLVMIRDALSMVNVLLADQLFEKEEYEPNTRQSSGYKSLGSVKIKGKKYPNLSKAAYVFINEYKTLLEHPDTTSVLIDEPVFELFTTCYYASREAPLKSYFQYRKFQSLLSIFLMEIKLNIFYSDKELSPVSLWPLDYHLIIETIGVCNL